MSTSLNFDTEQLSSMELYSLQLQKVVADFTDFDAITKQYVDQKVSQAKAELTDGASSALDTFKELQDYLTASGVAGGLVEQIAALSAAVATEQGRAEAIEASLQASLLSEIGRATTKENELQSEVDTTQVALGVDSEGKYQPSGAATHISTAYSFKNADELLDVAIENERIAREAAANTLQNSLETQIATLSSQQSGDNSAVIADLDAEVTRATTRENQLQTDIDAEATRAQAREASLQTNIDANYGDMINKHGEAIAEVANEEDRARNAESALETKIEEETSRALGAESGLQANLDGVNAALSADLAANTTSLEAQIQAEQERAEQAEEALGDRPHNGENGGFDVQHVEGNPDNKYIYFSRRWRLHGSSDGKRLIFEYNKGDDITPNFVSAVPFISHQ